ncbi:MAG TPA: metal ABC transporter permease [Acholeplasma sp.]|nr:metal ABC transporter permease [Acholeplasma sp.]
MNDFLSNYILILVLVGTMLLGAVAGLLGVFTILRKQALIGDALSHAALPGVVLSFIFFHEKSMIVLIFGAAIAAFVAIFLMQLIKKYSKIKNDAILAIILSSFFGFGQVLLSLIRNEAGASQAGLDHFIFGQAAAISTSDILTIAASLVIVLIILTILWRHIKLFIFNEAYYQSLGFNPVFVRMILSVLTVLIVVVSIKSVGVILMSALLIAPGVAARQWSQKLFFNVLLAGIFGAISGLIGTILSANISKLPTGPVIVISASLIVIVSLLFAPKSGYIGNRIRFFIYQKRVSKFKVLIHIYENSLISNSQFEEVEELVKEAYAFKKGEEYFLTDKGMSVVTKLLTGGDL